MQESTVERAVSPLSCRNPIAFHPEPYHKTGSAPPRASRWSLTVAVLCAVAAVVPCRMTWAELPHAAALHDIIGELILADNAAEVRRRSAVMSAPEKVRFLAEWVLPGQRRRQFRLTAEFSALDPVPDAIGAVAPGGQLVSPVFDLLEAASETGQLSWLLEQVERAEPGNDEFQQRAKYALLALIHLESRNQDRAAEAVQQLYAQVIRNVPIGMSDQWPETLVAWRAIETFHDEIVGGDLLTYLFSQRAQKNQPAGYWMWQNQIAALTGRNGHVSVRYTAGQVVQPLDLRQWVPFSRVRASSRGSGLPVPAWSQSEARVNKIAGHDEDYLFFRSPLAGDFDVEGEIASTQVLLGGTLAGNGSPGQIHVGNLRIGTRTEDIPHRLTPSDWWVHCRRSLRGEECRTYFNGQLVRTDKQPTHRDPWLAIRSWSRSHGSVRDLKITGAPRILKQVEMSAAKDLTGWVAYYNEPVGYPSATWHYLDDAESTGMIQALPWHEARGIFFESLLMYQRPMEQRGAVEYDFFYEPGRIETHPALDRLGFVIRPDGVHLHWITDSPFGSSDAAPDNLTFDKTWHRGSDQLPLKPGEWNHAKLELEGSLASFYLNGELVFQRETEANNRRLFGLFRWAGETEVRVRNVVMTGDWPMTLPEIRDQELADQMVGHLDRQREAMKVVFRHDFAADGFPESFFRQAVSRQSALRYSKTGIQVDHPTTGPWAASDIRLPFTAWHDFDVEVAFDGLTLNSDKDSCILLDIHLDDDQQHELRNLRIRTADQRQYLQVSLSAMQQSGGRSYSTRVQLPADVYAGRLRLARRGRQVYYLFAENDSAVFRLTGTETVSDRPTTADGIQLRVLGNGTGHTHVQWKSVTVHAERLTMIPSGLVSQRSLYRMNADGTGVRLVTSPAFGLSHLGSAEWSSDGRQLVCDMSEGGTATSRMVLMSSDGTNMTDLGAGCMPSLSADSRRLVFSDPARGIVRMKMNGSDPEVLDRSGWGTQWSPDGRTIAWGRGRQIVLLDVATGQQRELLTPAQSELIGGLYWNMGWSHDSRWIAFKARPTASGNNSRDLIAVADTTSPDGFKVIYSGPAHVNEDLTWHPDNRHVVCAMRLPQGKTLKLMKIDREASGAPEQLPGQPETWDVLDCDWSHDGQYISFAAVKPPEPIEWTPETVHDIRKE